MIIPICFSILPANMDIPYAWVFMKAVDFAKQYGWPVIAQEQYFELEEIAKKSAYYFSEDAMESFEYEAPSAEDLTKIIPVKIPQTIIREYIDTFPSETDASRAAVTQSWSEMEDWLVSVIRDLEAKTGERVDALISLVDLRVIKNAATKLNIEVFHFEWSTFRYPFYAEKLYYVDFAGLQQSVQLSERYEEFHKQKNPAWLLTRREILALFLRLKDIYALTAQQEEPPYDIGIVGKGYTTGYFDAYNGISETEMVTRAQRLFDREQIVMRYHPGFMARMSHAGIGHVHEGSSIDFILQCKRLLTAGSNVSFEASLFGRPAYDLGWSQYKLISNVNLEALEDYVPSDEMISYITFGFFVPSKLFWSREYLKWRLSKPSEQEIYEYHMNYIFELYKISVDAYFSLSVDERIQMILKNRMVQIKISGIPDEDSPEVKYYLDVTSRKEIRGWAYIENQENDGSEVYLQFLLGSDLITIPSQRYDREEVVTVFGNTKYRHSGFAVFPELLGRFDVKSGRIIVKTKDCTYARKLVFNNQVMNIDNADAYFASAITEFEEKNGISISDTRADSAVSHKRFWNRNTRKND